MLRAKTGTLDGVSALAGYVIDASGRALVFVVLLDKTPCTRGRPPALDIIGATLRTCGCGSPAGLSASLRPRLSKEGWAWRGPGTVE